MSRVLVILAAVALDAACWAWANTTRPDSSLWIAVLAGVATYATVALTVAAARADQRERSEREQPERRWLP